MAYLLAHRNPHGDNFYTTRRSPILGICVHITAGLEDLDATDDHSAERTAAYAASTDRSVSWHYGTDTDSEVVLLPDSYTAFHVRGYNSCLLGHEINKRHTDWRAMPKSWRDPTLRQAAKADAKRCKRHGIPIRKASKAELDRAIATGGKPVGLIGHTELDPSRRTDPGVVNGTDTFPWHEYLDLIRFYANGTSPASPRPTDTEELLMADVVLDLDDCKDIAANQYRAAKRGVDTKAVNQYWGPGIALADDPKDIVNSLRHQLGLPSI